jgi:polyphosphate kinase
MQKLKYFNRDLSWLLFNERVLLEAKDNSVPLYERIKFLAIYSSNLDEFFRVRVALLKRISVLNKEKLILKMKLSSPKELLAEIFKIVNKQQNLFGKIFRETIIPELLENKIHLYYSETYDSKHERAVEEIFYTRLLSFIQPIIIPKDEDNPIFLENRNLYMICDLEKDGRQYLGVVNIPSRNIARFQRLPQLGDVHQFTFIEDIIKFFSSVIFAGFKVKNHDNVKLNRDAELFLDDDYSVDIATKIKKSLKNRKIGNPSRFLYEPGMKSSTLSNLKKLLSVDDGDCILGGEYHNLDDLFSLPNPNGKELENISLPALPHLALKDKSSIFKDIEKKDVLLCFPYHRYDYILRFFNEAAINQDVTSVKATLYRVAENSHITNALISAARNGKQVDVLIEAKARFDEENNLKWAERMEEAGVSIRYSQQSIKVHAKVALITSKSKEGKIRKYAFLGTGNFNEKTADIYTDYALLTSDEGLTNELDQTLEFTFGNKSEIKLKELLVAQINMPTKFSKLIEGEIKSQLRGNNGRIILKLNNLQDKKMIRKLYHAAEQGVQIDLIIRGICCLIPQKNIKLYRVVDRFLEHSRVYIFNNSGNEKVYLGSADWMDRNLYRRIEVVFPVKNIDAKKDIRRNIDLLFDDNTKATTISPTLRNIRVPHKGDNIRAQHDFYEYLSQQSEVE